LIPFNSRRKRACTAVRHPDDSNKIRVFLKGAPEIVMEHCTKYVNAEGEQVELSQDKKQDVLENVVNEKFAKHAFRTLLIAFTDLTVSQYDDLKAANNDFQKEEDREILEQNMTMICIFALIDPLRDEIIESVRRCHDAGINIRMVTGDNLETAKAIAIQAGILDPNDTNEFACMEGKKFRETCGGLKRLDDPNNTGLLREEIGNKN